MKSYLQLIFIVCLICVFLVPIAAGTNIKVSKINGGCQIWWEAEDFDERDPEEGCKLGEEAEGAKVMTEGFYGTDVIIFPGESGFGDLKDWWALYSFDLPPGAEPGTWYFWCRISFQGAAHESTSHFLWVLNDPGDGDTVSKTRAGAGEIGDDDDRLFDDAVILPSLEWAWHGKNPLNDADKSMRGLDKELQAGRNVVMIWERESALDSTSMDVMMFADDSTYTPSDEDYESAVPIAGVEPQGKLPLTWGQIKLAY